MFDHLHCVKGFFLLFRWNFVGFNSWPLPLVLSLWSTKKSLDPLSSFSPMKYLYTLILFTPLSLFFPRLNSPDTFLNISKDIYSALRLFPYERCFNKSVSSERWQFLWWHSKLEKVIWKLLTPAIIQYPECPPSEDTREQPHLSSNTACTFY